MKRRTFLVIILSLVPGLAYIYLGKYQKAAGVLLITAGAVLGWIFSKSLLLKLLMVMIYLTCAVPSGLECWQYERYQRSASYTTHRWFVITLLLVTGFSALPLLWQSHKFSKTAKIAWTVAVPALAILFFSALTVYWNKIESYLEGYLK